MNGKKMAVQLSVLMGKVIIRRDISEELAYRIRKMAGRLQPIMDRIFFKTVKAQEMILECIHRTESLAGQLDAGGDSVYQSLTRLEKTFEELLRETYEFRVKAG